MLIGGIPETAVAGVGCYGDGADVVEGKGQGVVAPPHSTVPAARGPIAAGFVLAAPLLKIILFQEH